MNIIRVRHDRDFTIIGNAALRDKGLSLRARGLLAYLLSLPDGRPIDSDTLADALPEGRDAIRTALRELQTRHYLHRAKRQDAATGRWVTASYLLEVSDPTFKPPEAGFPGVGSPAVGQPVVGRPGPKEKNQEKYLRENPKKDSRAVAAKRSPAQQELDTLMEALINACGYERASITDPMWGNLRTAAATLRTVKAQPGDVAQRAIHYRLNHPEWELTPTSLAKWWADSATARPSTRNAAKQVGAALERRNWRNR